MYSCDIISIDHFKSNLRELFIVLSIYTRESLWKRLWESITQGVSRFAEFSEEGNTLFCIFGWWKCAIFIRIILYLYGNNIIKKNVLRLSTTSLRQIWNSVKRLFSSLFITDCTSFKSYYIWCRHELITSKYTYWSLNDVTGESWITIRDVT